MGVEATEAQQGEGQLPLKAVILAPHPSTEGDERPENQAGRQEGTLASQGKETPEAKKWA